MFYCKINFYFDTNTINVTAPNNFFQRNFQDYLIVLILHNKHPIFSEKYQQFAALQATRFTELFYNKNNIQISYY